MKKKLLFGILLICISMILVGCKKDEEVIDEEKELVGGWNISLDTATSTIDEDALKAFNAATEGYVGMDFEVVALLGKQVVSGTNYMFLCKGTPVTKNPTTSYKIVVVNKNLEGKSTILKANDFNFNDYVSTDISYEDEQIVGGWTTTIPSTGVTLEEKAQTAFDNAIKDTPEITYLPIALLGTQLVAGNNYAILCYGKTNDNAGIYLLTIYEDLSSHQEISSSAYIDLAVYNN